jgi:hypothetical protein
LLGQSDCCRATVILDNTSSTVSQSALNATTTSWNGLVFTPNSNYTLRSLTFVPEYTNPTTVDYTVRLFAVDGSNLPTGAALASKTQPSVSVVQQTSATNANAITLDLTAGSTGSWDTIGSTSYALVFSSTGQAGFGFSSTSSSTSEATFLGRTFTSNSGSTWGYGTTTTLIPWVQVTDVAPVPEPSTYVMALAGLACGGYTIFRRRERA